MSTSLTPLQSLTQPPTSSDPTTPALDSSTALANENTFLQLLITQIKNQDPTQPMDSTAFLSQLAQFSQLEQLIGIRQDLQTQQTTTPATTSTTGTTTDPKTGS